MRKTVTAATRPFSVRLPLTKIDDVETLASKCGYSSNQFIEYCLDGIIAMIMAPGKELPVPQIVTIARFIQASKPETIHVQTTTPTTVKGGRK